MTDTSSRYHGPGLLTRLGLIVGFTFGFAVGAWNAFKPDEPGPYPVDGLAIASMLAGGAGALIAVAIITVWHRRAERRNKQLR